MPTISVIVPVYKVEKYIHRCVDSILGQTFIDFELILVDDGSPDNCPAICDEYAEKDNRVHVIHQENGGLSAARNAGIDWAFANSDSQWLSFVDSDDWVHPSFLERLLLAAIKHQVPVSCCDFQRICDGEVPAEIGSAKTVLREATDVYCAACGIGIQAYPWRFLMHKSLFGNIRYPVGKIYEDAFTTYKLIFQTSSIATVEQALYYYFIRGISLSHGLWTPKQMDLIEAYEANLNFFQNHSSQKLAACVARGYLVSIHAQYSKMRGSSIATDEKKVYTRLLKRKMRYALWKYSRRAQVQLRTEGYLYAVAYPLFVWSYWFVKGQIYKLIECVNRK